MNPGAFKGKEPEIHTLAEKEAVDRLGKERAMAVVAFGELSDTLYLADTDIDTLADCHKGRKERGWPSRASVLGNAGANGSGISIR